MATNAQINETQIKDGSISDTQLSPGAGISYNKLNILNSIKNADIASSAAIAYSKLNLAGGIVNSDIANGAAITYSKLNLTGGIVNNDIATGASIDAAKIGGGNISNIEFSYLEGVTANIQSQINALSGGSGVYNPNIVVITNSFGNFVSSTVTDIELGYLSGATSSIQTQLNGKEPTISSGTSSQYWRGDKTWQTLSTSAVTEGANLYYTDIRADARITAQKGVANGIVPLDASSKIASSYLPAIAIVNTFVVASQTAMLALTVETGDVAVRTDINKSFILAGTDPTILGDWQELLTSTDAVSSVNGQTGVVSLTTTNIAEGTNLYYTDARAITAPLTGYTSGAGTISATDTILQAIQKLNGNDGLLAPLASPSFTGDISGSGRLILSGNNSFTAASSNAYLYHNTINGLVVYGNGSSYDVMCAAGTGATVWAIPTGASSIEFFGAVYPNTTGNIGTTTKPWTNYYVSSGGSINFNNGDVLLTHSTNALSFSGAANGYSFDNIILGTTGSFSGSVTSTGTASTTLTDITQALRSGSFVITNTYLANGYTNGLYWATNDDNPTKPKAGIFMKETGSGTSIFIGTSNNYSVGITSSISIDQNGSVSVQSITANTYGQFGSTGGATGYISMSGITSGTVTLSVADAAGTWTMKLPTSAGTSGYFLQTDGSGNTTWAAASGGASTSATLFTGTASGTYNNVTSVTVLPSGVGSKTLAANYLTAGKTIRIKMSGTFYGVGSTGAFGFKLGSTTLMSFSSVGGVNGYNFQLEAVMTCMTTGASGTAIGSIKLIAYNSSYSVGWSGFANGSTINTTISNALDIITTMPSNLTATIYDVTIEALN